MGWPVLRCLSLLVALVAAVPADAFEGRAYPEFVQINAVAPRPDGGFAIAGFLRGEGNRTPSGFLEIAANGEPLAKPALLPTPDAKHPQIWVSGMIALANGDYVVTGWADTAQRKVQGWVARVAPNGDEVWNVTTDSDLEQRFYSVKRLSNGSIIAVGRVQVGSGARDAARGLVTILDEATGKQILAKDYPFSNATLRSAFQDVAELADGNLVFVGWMTKQDNTDDIWVMRANPKGDRMNSVSFGEAANDVAYSAVPFGTGVAIAATTRRSRDNSIGTLVVYDKDLQRRTPYNLDRWAPGISQGRALLEIASTGQVVVVGQNQRSPTADAIALGAIVATQGPSAAVEDAGATISTFRAVAVDSAGTIAMAGDTRDAKDRPTRGFVGFRSGAVACAPDQRRIDEISTALTGRAKQRLTACAHADRPTRFRVGNGGRDLAVVVRPMVGDVDAMLMRGNEILDTSLNSMQRPELLLLPPSGGNLEVAVSGLAPYSVFEIGVVTLTAPGVDDSAVQADEPFLSLSLRWLGYDLLGAEHAGEGAEGVGLRRAIMAFQAGEGFPVTGQLSAEQLDRLYTCAARAVDIDARKAAEIARDVARDVSESGYDEERYALRSLRAGVRDGKLYGIGEFRFGGTFEGEWLESLDTGAAQRPGTGILRASDTCSIALRNQGALAVETLNDVLDKAIGVLRLGNRIEFSRDLAGLLPERDSTEPVTLESICSPPKEEEQDN